MIRRLYDWTMALAGHRHALLALAAVAFVESSVFPIPPDILLIPMILAAPQRAFLYALVATIASVLGGLAGYGIGYFLFDTVGEPVLAFYGMTAEFEKFSESYNAWGAWAVLIAGMTPFPYKVITILSGATQLSLPVFIVASIVARGLRFVIVAALLWKFGAPIRDFIERRLGLMFALALVLLIGGFIAVKYLA
ncbi:DedA family protein [Gemmobacter lutimaris]|uniref:DedA family protein n=1 Tax=Gemmobacter lutimaris TaxID=2306023 RepID=A0A398C3D5_9RHOB|nr:YqaA family protein [Gemmobacter lutimaris]RID93906.1 DedA family protein [Gemmobacter lutimaris]